MKLNLDHVRLRKLKKQDSSAIAELLNNRKIWDNLRDYIPHPYSEKDAEDFIKRENIEDPLTAFAILHKKTFVGIISLKKQSDIHRISAEIGYWIGEPFWGKGITFRAIKLMTKYGFDVLDLNKIYAIIMDHNEPSKRVLEKAGYSQEGTFSQSVIKNGVIYDEARYGITKSEFIFDEAEETAVNTINK